jgi:hypothetical protein
MNNGENDKDDFNDCSEAAAPRYLSKNKKKYHVREIWKEQYFTIVFLLNAKNEIIKLRERKNDRARACAVSRTIHFLAFSTQFGFIVQRQFCC